MLLRGRSNNLTKTISLTLGLFIGILLFACVAFQLSYNRFFDKMLDYSFQNTDTADGVISKLATNIMVIYPFISEQKDFGYSDVTQSNMEQQGKIREHFARANKHMKSISLK